MRLTSPKGGVWLKTWCVSCGKAIDPEKHTPKHCRVFNAPGEETRLAALHRRAYSHRFKMKDAPGSVFPHRHLLGIEGLSPLDIQALLDLADAQVEVSRQVEKRKSTLRGRTQINLFFEPSTRTQSSFEIAVKRLGADVMNMSVGSSSVKKGETLIDTAATLNAIRTDLIIVRHHAAGAVHLLAQKVDCSVVNAGDGAHEHPTQALLDALTLRRNKGRIEG